MAKRKLNVTRRNPLATDPVVVQKFEAAVALVLAGAGVKEAARRHYHPGICFENRIHRDPRVVALKEQRKAPVQVTEELARDIEQIRVRAKVLFDRDIPVSYACLLVLSAKYPEIARPDLASLLSIKGPRCAHAHAREWRDRLSQVEDDALTAIASEFSASLPARDFQSPVKIGIVRTDLPPLQRDTRIHHSNNITFIFHPVHRGPINFGDPPPGRSALDQRRRSA